MIPLLNPESEVRYNDAKKGSRTVIERCFEILKRRLSCLHEGSV